jgi:glutathione S-transferase
LKFYNSLGPNPRLVRMFLCEKGIEIPSTEVDLMAGENRQAPYTDINPGGQMPCLVLDDGSAIAETIAICEYLEEANPTPALIGTTAEERANTRMWTRRVELKVTSPLTDGFRYGEGIAMFKDRMRTIPQASDDLKTLAREGLTWLDAQIAGRDWIAGDAFSLADITLYCFLDFGTGVGQPIDPTLKNVAEWFARAAARPSAEDSLHPVAKAGGMRA